jgi:glycosyltransferase involved in cell wall biosynthesis
MGELRRSRVVIVLLEPTRAAGFDSGGYRYQAEIGSRLAARGEGVLHAIAPRELRAAVARFTREPNTIVVADGLFAEHAPLPAGVIALLHMVPASAPWAEALLPVITTAATTAAAPAVATRACGIAVVRPGIDACFRPPAAPRTRLDRLRVVQVGTVCPAKGQLLVVHALQSVAANCTLTLLGDVAAHPDYVATVRAAAGSLPLTMLGVVPPANVAAHLHGSELFVSASRHESFGMAAAEAAACGVPVFAFATGEIAESIGGGGWLVPAAASDATFVEQLRSVITNPTQLRLPPSGAPPRRLATWDDATFAFGDACRRLAASLQKRTPT